MLVQIRVRKKIYKHTKTNYTCYKYYGEGHDLTYGDIEGFDKIVFTWSDNMDAEDIKKVLDKWKHKL